MLEIVFLVFVCGYFIQSVIFSSGVSKKFTKIKADKLPDVTVIVAARDEEENILRCLKSLDALIYPEKKLEIILVDDNSKDNTGQIIDEFISGKVKFRKIVTKKEIGKLRGKTNALANAIEAAKGEIIFTTDADCVMHPMWVYSTSSFYQPDVAVVNGYTTQEAFNGFSGMQAIDFIYLLTVAAGTININKPLTCIGNNMSYRKTAYHEVGGYESIPFSVTEDFALLYAIHKLKKYKIIFPFNNEALVTSLPCPNLKTLYHQKKRWSVGGLGIPPRGYFIMFFGFITNLCVLLTPFFFTSAMLYLAIFKIGIDFFMLYPVHSSLGIKKNLKYFPYFEIYFILYVVAIPFILFVSRKVYWKGRKY